MDCERVFKQGCVDCEGYLNNSVLTVGVLKQGGIDLFDDRCVLNPGCVNCEGVLK